MFKKATLNIYKHKSWSVLHHHCKALSHGQKLYFQQNVLNLTNTQNINLKRKIENGPSLQEFIRNSGEAGTFGDIQKEELIPYLNSEDLDGQNRKGMM